MDTIVLEGMVFYGYHGVKAEEKALGQRFVVDLEVELDLSRAGRSDDLKDTADYGDIYRVVKKVIEGPSKNLMEALAEEIAAQVLKGFPVSGVLVSLSKPGVAIKGSILDAATVEIYRERNG